jgi:hypothetical protein
LFDTVYEYRITDIDLFSYLLKDPRVGLVADDDSWFNVAVLQSIHGVGHHPHGAVVDVDSVQVYPTVDLPSHDIGAISVTTGVPAVFPKYIARLQEHGGRAVSERGAVLRSVLSSIRDIASTAHTITPPESADSQRERAEIIP